jgi:hypothetical protein
VALTDGTPPRDLALKIRVENGTSFLGTLLGVTVVGLMLARFLGTVRVEVRNSEVNSPLILTYTVESR